MTITESITWGKIFQFLLLNTLKPLKIWQKTKVLSFRKRIIVTVLILDKCSYIKAIEEILHDNTKVA